MIDHQQLANAIRFLSIDAVQKAKSGHPGMPMGMADIATVLWREFLQHNPNNPNWFNRDRFVLSNGHGSMLQYALLHLSGYDVSIDDIKQFRQLHSKTPGHPEYGYTPGVETTTGPLGQGLANAVGMAIAERILAAQFNRPEHQIVDHYTYVFMGDGCLMEGISHEVCSLAGTLGLGKLIAFWDDNSISIDGDVKGWFTDDNAKRFAAYGWHVVTNVDGHNPEAIRNAIKQAQAVKDKPSLICCKTIIAYGAPTLAGTHESHGAPLGDQEIAATRAHLNWQFLPFEIPANIYQAWDSRMQGQALEKGWNEKFAVYEKNYPELATELKRRLQTELPKDWHVKSQTFINACVEKQETIATRKASQNALNAYSPDLPELMGGSADLTGSNLTMWSGSKAINANDTNGNYIYYGVREFGMSAIMNGLALHGGFIPYGGTFLTFVDYARNAVRMAALMKQRAIFVYTHDSIGLGEDGPTHQPVEHINMLRMTPNMSLWRPCDTVETAVAWQQAIQRQHGPTCLLFSRQNLPFQMRSEEAIDNIKRGGYVLLDCQNMPQAIIIATGSEVMLAMEAAKQLTMQGKHIRVVSMPSTDRFNEQEKAYQEKVLPGAITARVAVEAGAKDFWYKYVGLNGRIIGFDRYGESAPAADVYKALGITVESIVSAVNELL